MGLLDIVNAAADEVARHSPSYDAEPSTSRKDDIDLAITAGLILESPAEAYLLGQQHGRNEAAAAAARPRSDGCWKCNAPAEPPSLDDQVRALAELHYQKCQIFHWAPSEFQALRGMLLPGDVLCGPAFGTLMYETVRILRNGKMIDILRRQLIEAAKAAEAQA